MFDPVSVVIGGALVAAAYLSGRVRGRRRPKPVQNTAATCGCGHPLAVHDMKTDTCDEQVRLMNYLPDGTRNGWKWERCRCRKYIGPRPLEEFLAPVILPHPNDPESGPSR
jgi:hypothetical protein